MNAYNINYHVELDDIFAMKTVGDDIYDARVFILINMMMMMMSYYIIYERNCILVSTGWILAK